MLYTYAITTIYVPCKSVRINSLLALSRKTFQRDLSNGRARAQRNRTIILLLWYV